MKRTLLLLLALIPITACCQSAAPVTKYTTVRVSNDSLFTPLNYAIAGHVRLRVDETVITCDSAVVDGKNSTVSAYGNVIVSPNGDLHLSSSYIKINFANKKGIGLSLPHYDRTYILRPLNK